jgi:hypothetical protein
MSNSDPNFDKILSNFTNTSSKNYPQVRKRLYYFVCIVVRLILYSLVLFYKDKLWMPYLILLVSLFSIYNLYNSIYSNTGKKQTQWWSKKFQLVISILLLLVSICIILQNRLNFKFKINTVVIPLLLYISLFGGILQSLFITFK